MFSPQRPWSYWRTERPLVREMSLGRGTSLALPIHFHTEDQISLVLAGCRFFNFMGESVPVFARQAIRIPAGIPHSSRDCGDETLCINLYNHPGFYQDPSDIAALLRDIVNEDPISIVQHPFILTAKLLTILPGDPSRVIDHARSHNMSREGYSRRFRRHYGISPQNAQILSKLNTAKILLRDGHNLADTAFAAGFSDQSHLGRLFRRTFGTTPRCYQKGT
ncbi:helix-turn-helix domain-containing protein [Saccharibacter sp. 17.LH.SD]|uniref:helix-turn-helix domain-containing protein n=1 Tax=Saccharibacter sp. 17.LH.SD TaxID=2689393 RepID=UPI0013706709|nr:helix-turn-helix domain-containing protein [Saccharibacter sp. 17.LH.SD]MXV44431.1 helix-turn-helix domain-containing protein [Saccharibacter sp. 17.LH.SD]